MNATSLALALIFVLASTGAAQVGPQINGPTKLVIPHFAFGGGWESELVLTNTGPIGARFVDVQLFDQLGSPLFARPVMTLGDGPALNGELRASFQAIIWGGGVTRVRFADVGGLQVGWVKISYTNADFGEDIIGGLAILRQHIEGLPDLEATVPLSSNQDWTFVLPFDNRDGFVTSFALVNSGAKALQVRVGVLGATGAAMARGLDPVDMAPGQQMAFTLPERFPVTVGKAGVLVVQAETGGALGGTLSAIGFRFSPSHAFTTLPVINRPGMYRNRPLVP